MREYVQPALSAGESFDYIGISNNRDTVYMGDTRPCAAVLYNVHHDATGSSTRHCDIVIFSNDYKVILNVTPCDFDPIEYAGDKVRQEFRKALQELIKR